MTAAGISVISVHLSDPDFRSRESVLSYGIRSEPAKRASIDFAQAARIGKTHAPCPVPSAQRPFRKASAFSSRQICRPVRFNTMPNADCPPLLLDPFFCDPHSIFAAAPLLPFYVRSKNMCPFPPHASVPGIFHPASPHKKSGTLMPKKRISRRELPICAESKTNACSRRTHPSPAFFIRHPRTKNPALSCQRSGYRAESPVGASHGMQKALTPRFSFPIIKENPVAVRSGIQNRKHSICRKSCHSPQRDGTGAVQVPCSTRHLVPNRQHPFEAQPTVSFAGTFWKHDYRLFRSTMPGRKPRTAKASSSSRPIPHQKERTPTCLSAMAVICLKRSAEARCGRNAP